jgi:hypothetical protein
LIANTAPVSDAVNFDPYCAGRDVNRSGFILLSA